MEGVGAPPRAHLGPNPTGRKTLAALRSCCHPTRLTPHPAAGRVLPWCAAHNPAQHYIHAPTMYEIQSVRATLVHTQAPLCRLLHTRSCTACHVTAPRADCACCATQMTNRKLKFGTAIVTLVVTGFGIPIWAANRAIRKARG